MKHELRKFIDSFKNFVDEDKSWWYDIDDKLKRLRSYIHILDNTTKFGDVNADTAKVYFTIIHNFLVIERQFFPEVEAANKELNKYLKLKPLNGGEEVMAKFRELYDTKHPVRFSVETLDSIESIRKFIAERPNIYSKLINI
tara:strand:- start:41 stop:466 length:426 start_codon:yes stop_codon:yes gene_type:complete